jgi:transposase InsO family protein
VGAELGVRERRHIDVRDGAEDLHRLHRPAIGTVKDRLGGAHGHRVVVTLHELNEPAKGHGTVLLTLDALDQALYDRPIAESPRLIHHSDRGVQYLSIRYTERLTAAGIELSVGSSGDSYDTALAESVIGLYKTEVIRRRGPWRGLDDLELATLTWYNAHRLLEPLDYVAPAEFKEAFYDRQRHEAQVAVLT